MGNGHRKKRVWAPSKKTVSLVLGQRTIALESDGVGYFEFDAPRPGERYGFSLEGGKALPDPRSRSQPDGVHALSEWIEKHVDDGGSPLKPVPLKDAVLYELHVGTFSEEGTFQGAAARLGHLKDLGVTHVELMPVGAFMGEFGWGYDGVALFAVHAPYGGPAGLRSFVEACHALGLAVILDVVYNHLGPSGNYLGQFGPYFTDRYHTSWGDALNFDGPESDEVRRFFIDNALYWLKDFGIDGLRLDAVQAIFDVSARTFLEELVAAVRALEKETGRQVVLIAETHLNDPKMVRPHEDGGRGMDATWSDDFHHALHALLTGETHGYYQDFGTVQALAEAFERGFVLDGRPSKYYRRRHGAPAADMQSHQFLVYLQNHDQVGNRARGDRIGHGLDVDQLEVGAAAVLLGPYLPMLFQGEEWGSTSPFPFFADPPDLSLARAIRKGRLNEYRHFGWKRDEVPDPVARTTFEASRLDWSELEDDEHRDLLVFYRQLLSLRKETGGCVPRAELGVRFDEQARWLQFDRGKVRVLLYFGKERFEWSAPSGSCRLRSKNVEEPPTVEAPEGAKGQSTLPFRFRGPGVLVVDRSGSPKP